MGVLAGGCGLCGGEARGCESGLQRPWKTLANGSDSSVGTAERVMNVGWGDSLEGWERSGRARGGACVGCGEKRKRRGSVWRMTADRGGRLGKWLATRWVAK